MIYVSQSGSPRVVIFDESMEVQRPLVLSAWSNRLLIKGDSPDDELEVYYRESIGIPAQIEKVSPRVVDLVAFLGHKTTIEAPSPGIGLSYGETIGALHQLWRNGHLTSDFKAEQDRILGWDGVGQVSSHRSQGYRLEQILGSGTRAWEGIGWSVHHTPK